MVPRLFLAKVLRFSSVSKRQIMPIKYIFKSKCLYFGMKWWSNLNVKLQYINTHGYSVTRQSVSQSVSQALRRSSETQVRNLRVSRWWASTGCLSWCCLSDISNMMSVFGQIIPIYSIRVTHNFSCAWRLSRDGDAPKKFDAVRCENLASQVLSDRKTRPRRAADTTTVTLKYRKIS